MPIHESHYDADKNNRIPKSVDPDGIGLANPEIETYAYSGDHLALVFDNAGNVIQRFLHGFVIDQVLAQEEVNAVTGAIDDVFWTLSDHQGTLRDVVDNSGVLVNHLEYDSFGNVTAQTDLSVELRFRYTGREWDTETGLHQYRARYFDASIAQFLSEDPLGLQIDTNLVRYVGNSPANWNDPSGMRWVSTSNGVRVWLGSDGNYYQYDNNGYYVGPYGNHCGNSDAAPTMAPPSPGPKRDPLFPDVDDLDRRIDEHLKDLFENYDSVGIEEGIAAGFPPAIFAALMFGNDKHFQMAIEAVASDQALGLGGAGVALAALKRDQIRDLVKKHFYNL